MFDKLIVSEPEGADFKSRRGYFMVSSVIVGILFTTAVVISIFAAEVGLGNNSLELVEMIAPPDMAVVPPEAPQPRSLNTTSQSQSNTPTRQTNMSRVDEPTIVPTTTSVMPNNEAARPNRPYNLDAVNSDAGPGPIGRPDTGPGPDGTGLSTNPTTVEPDREIAPPPVIKPPQPKNPIVSRGVINGKAKYLPPPPYPAAAKAVGITGKVDVQVMIDEEGKVVSANAVSGHQLLRDAAERAARNARFSTTYLSDVPVKVTGIIVYNFSR